jgi:hypothetical protein
MLFKAPVLSFETVNANLTKLLSVQKYLKTAGQEENISRYLLEIFWGIVNGIGAVASCSLTLDRKIPELANLYFRFWKVFTSSYGRILQCRQNFFRQKRGRLALYKHIAIVCSIGGLDYRMPLF